MTYIVSFNKQANSSIRVSKITGGLVSIEPFSVPIVATGGVETTVTDGGVTYKVHTFTASGDFTVSQTGLVEYLIVAGGGSGGTGADRTTGGGGAGGVITGSRALTTIGIFPVVIGSGGSTNTNGNLSSFDGLIASGGGCGARVGFSPSNGGSGGGARHTGAVVGTGITGQGNNGGLGYDSGNTTLMFGAGGGGGAGQVGQAASTSTTGRAGAGGSGSLSSINGTSNYYGGGGGGGAQYGTSATSYQSGLGGPGGGGDGARNTVAGFASTSGSNATPNTGGGGGGGAAGDSSNTAPGGQGGSGIVIIRYQT